VSVTLEHFTAEIMRAYSAGQDNAYDRYIERYPAIYARWADKIYEDLDLVIILICSKEDYQLAQVGSAIYQDVYDTGKVQE